MRRPGDAQLLPKPCLSLLSGGSRIHDPVGLTNRL